MLCSGKIKEFLHWKRAVCPLEKLFPFFILKAILLMYTNVSHMDIGITSAKSF